MEEKTTLKDGGLIKVRTPDQVREWVRKYGATVDPDEMLLMLDRKKVDDPDFKSKFVEIVEMLAHERHYIVAESIVDERWRPAIMDLANCIQKEYCCTTNSEIALAGLAASAYYRSLKAARKMNALLGKDEIGMVGVNLMGQVSKEIDRAERQYLSAIETLRSRRQPQMNVKIQTKTAFFNENQTINCTPQSYAKPNDPQ